MNSTTFPELVGVVEEKVCSYTERFQIESIPFTSMEYLDLDISYGNSTLRVVT